MTYISKKRTRLLVMRTGCLSHLKNNNRFPRNVICTANWQSTLTDQCTLCFWLRCWWFQLFSSKQPNRSFSSSTTTTPSLPTSTLSFYPSVCWLNFSWACSSLVLQPALLQFSLSQNLSWSLSFQSLNEMKTASTVSLNLTSNTVFSKLFKRIVLDQSQMVIQVHRVLPLILIQVA